MKISFLLSRLVISSLAALPVPVSAQTSGGWYVFSGNGDEIYAPDRYQACSVMLEKANVVVYSYYHPQDGTNKLQYSYLGPSTIGKETSLFCVHINIAPNGSTNGTYYIMEAAWRCPGMGGFVPQNMTCGLAPNNAVEPKKNYCEAGANESVGDPINVGTASLEEEAIDFQTFGQQPLMIKRLYRSISSPGQLLGDGKWKFDFEYQLVDLNNVVRINSPTGEIIDFNKNSDGTYSPADNQGPASIVKGDTTYDLRLSDGTALRFVQSGPKSYSIKTINRRRGASIDINYNSSTIAITDGFGNKLYLSTSGLPSVITEAMVYDSSNKPVSKIVYGYKNSSTDGVITGRNLTSVVRSHNPSGSSSPAWVEINRFSYLYEDSIRPDLMTAFFDERGVKYSTWTYDQTGLASSSSLPNETDKTIISYDSTNNSRVVTTSLGRKKNYNYNLINNSLKITSVSSPANVNAIASSRSIVYDNNGNISMQIDEEGRKTSYSRDVYGRPLSISIGVP